MTMSAWELEHGECVWECKYWENVKRVECEC